MRRRGLMSDSKVKQRFRVKNLPHFIEEVWHDFLINRNGIIIVMSEDNALWRLLSKVVRDYEQSTGFVKTNLCIQRVLDTKELLQAIDRGVVQENPITKEKSPIVVFFDLILKGSGVDYIPSLLKTRHPNNFIKTIALSSECDNEDGTFHLLAEQGVDKIIVRPFSINSVMEITANVIKPDSVFDKFVDECHRFLTEGKPDSVIHLCNAVLLKKKPNSAKVFVLLGNAYRDKGNKTKAEEFYLKAIDADPMFLIPRQALADFYRKIGATDKFIKCLRELERISPKNLPRKLELVNLFLGQGSSSEAKTKAQEALKIFRKNIAEQGATIFAQIAEAFMEKDPDYALELFEQAISIKGEFLCASDSSIFNHAAILLRRKEDYPGAIELYKKALSISKNDENLLYNMGKAWYEWARANTRVDPGIAPYNEAANYFYKVLVINSIFYRRSLSTAEEFGLVLYKQGNYERATEIFKWILTQDPKDIQAKGFLKKMGG